MDAEPNCVVCRGTGRVGGMECPCYCPQCAGTGELTAGIACDVCHGHCAQCGQSAGAHTAHCPWRLPCPDCGARGFHACGPPRDIRELGSGGAAIAAAECARLRERLAAAERERDIAVDDSRRQRNVNEFYMLGQVKACERAEKIRAEARAWKGEMLAWRALALAEQSASAARAARVEAALSGLLAIVPRCHAGGCGRPATHYVHGGTAGWCDEHNVFGRPSGAAEQALGARGREGDGRG